MEKEVKKHVAAVRVGEVIGLLGRKTWNVLLLNAYDNLLSQDYHRIKVSDLCDIIGCNTGNYKYIDTILDELSTTKIKWDIGGGCREKGVWLKNNVRTAMLASAEIVDGVIVYEFSRKLSKYLYNPEIYQKINIAQQRLFKSASSLALWENSIRFINVGSTGLSDLQEWRELLGATAKTYDQFKDFNKFVIAPSVKEINKVSSIEVQPYFKKSGRKITHIGFTVVQKGQMQLSVPEILEEAKASKEFEELVAYGINDIQALSWIQDYGYAYIREKLELTKENEKGGKIKKVSGFLVSAIKGDFKSEKQVTQLKRAVIAKAKTSEDLEKKREDLKSKLAREFAKNEKEKFIASLSEDEVQAFMNKLLAKEDLDRYTANAIRTKGLNAPSVGKYIIDEIEGFEQRKETFISQKLENSSLVSMN
jgi:plasmid replication initiation protein